MYEGNLYMYGISRVDRIRKDGRKEHAWFVRLHHVNRKPAVSKWFYDNGGGISQSLAAAIEFRDANVQRDKIKQHPFSTSLENIKAEQHRTPKAIRDKWKKERLERRIKIVEERGRGKIYIGTGLKAAQEARKMGASKVTCWKIRSGRQDSYTVGDFMLGYDLVWEDKIGRGNLDLQKKNGKKKIELGTGREAALKAQELGASKTVCTKIFRGEQSFFRCCNKMPHFVANGFKRELTQEVIDKIKHLSYRYSHNNALDVAQEVMLNYVGRYEVINEDDLIKRLVLKYDKILRLQDNGRKNEVPLYAHFSKSGDEYDITDRIVYNQWLEKERFESAQDSLCCEA